MTICQRIKLLLILLAWQWSGCALLDNGPANKPRSTGLIATPASYYSTGKARYLGTKYKENLDRLAARIARNSSTSELQFANNISSVGGIGFFTHSATKTADERYLEVVLATPETFKTKGEYSEKVNQLFTRYGQELLGMLAGDTQIYQDQELTGYGLNLTWRNPVSESPSNRVTLARAIIYFQKDRVSKFLQGQLSQQDLLSDAVIFAMEEDGPLNLVSYQPRESTADFRPAIREDDLTAGTLEAKSSSSPSKVVKAPQQNEPQREPAKSASRDSGARAAANIPVPLAEKPELKGPLTAAHKDPAQPSPPADSAKVATEQIALTKPSMTIPPVATAPELLAPDVTPTPAVEPLLEAEPSEMQLNEIINERAPEVKTESSAKAASDSPMVQPRILTPKPEPVKETEKISQPVLALKPFPDVKTKTNDAIKKQDPAALGAPVVVSPPSKATVEETATTAPFPAAAKVENRQPVIERAAAAPMSAPRGSENTPKTSASANTSELQQARTAEVAQSRADLVAPAAKVGSLRETKRAESAASPLPTAKTAMAIMTPEPAKSGEVRKTEAASGPGAAEKLSDTAAARKSEPPVPTVAKVPPHVEVPIAPAVRTTAPERAVLRREPPNSEVATPPQVKAGAVPETPLSNQTMPELVPARKVEAPTPVVVAKGEPQVTMSSSMPSIAAKFPEDVADKTAPEQLAILRKPPEPAIEKKPLARQAPRSLEGFIIQIAFNDKEKAQSWAEKMVQRGYAVSVTEAGVEGALRVRLGNFSIRDDAERQLRNLKQEGMSGIIINLPLAFRPEARVSVP